MTVALTLSVISFHLIIDKPMREKLQTELKSVMPEPHARPKWTQLDQLPYLVSWIGDAKSFSSNGICTDESSGCNYPGRFEVLSSILMQSAF